MIISLRVPPFTVLDLRSGLPQHRVFGGAVSTALEDLLSRCWGLTVGNSLSLCLDLS